MKKTNSSRKNSHDNNQMFIDDGINVDARIIHICQDIDQELTSKVIRGIQMMLIKNKEPIEIYINSFGGDPYSGFGLYSFIRSIKEVTFKTFNIGSAMSAGSVIFLAGDERYMYEGTAFMFHTVASEAKGKLYPNMNDEVEECKKVHLKLSEIYGYRTKRDQSYWYKKIKNNDIYLHENEALELGVVDKVIKEDV